MGILHDEGQIRAYDEMLFAAVKRESVTPVRRLYGDGFVVDEAIWHGYIADGRPFLLHGKSGDVSFRILHVFEIVDGRITRRTCGATSPPSSTSWRRRTCRRRTLGIDTPNRDKLRSTPADPALRRRAARLSSEPHDRAKETP